MCYQYGVIICVIIICVGWGGRILRAMMVYIILTYTSSFHSSLNTFYLHQLVDFFGCFLCVCVCGDLGVARFGDGRKQFVEDFIFC